MLPTTLKKLKDIILQPNADPKLNLEETKEEPKPITKGNPAQDPNPKNIKIELSEEEDGFVDFNRGLKKEDAPPSRPNSSHNSMQRDPINILVEVDPIEAEETRKLEHAKRRKELEKLESQLKKDFKTSRILYIMSLVFTFGTILGMISLSLMPPFDLALVPVALWVIVVACILAMGLDSLVTRSTDNQKLTTRAINYAIAGNLGVLIYLIVKIIDVIQKDGFGSTKFIQLLAFTFFFLFFDIIFLILISPESTRLLHLFEYRDLLMVDVWNNSIFDDE